MVISCHCSNRDLYHTCYVLSGLAIAQGCAGTALGGSVNALVSWPLLATVDMACLF